MNETLNDFVNKPNRINLRRTTPKHRNTNVKPSTNNSPKSRFDYYANCKNKEKEKVLLYISLFFFVLSLIFFIYEDNDLDDIYLIPYGGYIFLRALFFTAIEAGIFYLCRSFIQNKLFKINLSKEDSSIICYASIIGLLLFNTALLEKLNISLDKSKVIKRFVKITLKDKYTSRKHKTEHYSIYFQSWKNSFLFSDLKLKANEDTFYKLDSKKIICLPTKKGFFGFDYLVNQRSIYTVDKELFPADTKFPLTEEEANKIMKKVDKP